VREEEQFGLTMFDPIGLSQTPSALHINVHPQGSKLVDLPYVVKGMDVSFSGAVGGV